MTSVYGRLSMRRCPLEPSTPGRRGHTTTAFYKSLTSMIAQVHVRGVAYAKTLK